MKITSGNKLLVAALLAGTAQLSAAAEINNTPYFAAMGTYEIGDQDRLLENGYGGIGALGFPMGAYFAPEIYISGLRADHFNAGGNDNIFGAGVNFAIYPFTRKPIVAPFVAIGGGAEYNRRQFVGNNTSGTAHVSGGALIALTPSHSWSLRVEGGRYAIFDDTYVAGQNHIMDTRVSVGFQVALGKDPVPPAPPSPPPPPPPPAQVVPVVAPSAPPPPAPETLKDSDGDGVLDNTDQCPNTPRGMKVDSLGCAIKTAVLVMYDVNFEIDKAVLTADAKKALGNVLAGLNGQPSMKLRIDGHTDSTGSNAHNLKLSKARANAVKQYLVENNIEASRLQTEGYGESRPLTTNSTDAGRAQNRRVEFRVMK